MEAFLREWLKGKDNEGTNERYSHIVDLFLTSLGRKAQSYLTSISHKDIQEFIKSREEMGLAPKTINVDVKTLNTAFNLAKKLHFIEANPVEKALALNPIKGKSMERFPFTPEQVASLLEVAKDEWKTAIMFGYFIGARLEDCVNMQWSNIDFAENVVDYISRKRHVRAVVPMAPQLQAHLEEIASTDNPNPNITPDLAHIYERQKAGGKTGLSATFHSIMLKAGIDPQTVEGQGKRKFNRLSFHSLRHAFNSLLANHGVDQETRMALIGQVTKAVNADYTHLDLAKLQGALKKLPALTVATVPPQG